MPNPPPPSTRGIGVVFRNMTTLCPQEISLYGRCVIANTDTIDKNVCEKEFEALRHCFRKARVKGR